MVIIKFHSMKLAALSLLYRALPVLIYSQHSGVTSFSPCCHRLLQLTQLRRPKIQVAVEEEQLMKILMRKEENSWNEIEQQLQDADKKGKSGFSP